MDEKIYKLLLDLQQEVHKIHSELGNMRSEMQSMYSELKGAEHNFMQQMEKREAAISKLAESQNHHYETLHHDCEALKQQLQDREGELKLLEQNKLDKNALRRIG